MYGRSVAIGDFNNDSRPDIAVANDQDNDVSVLLGLGDGSFKNQSTYPVGYFPSSIGVGDLNNDSLIDIVVINQRGDDVTVLLGSYALGFVKRSTLMTSNRSRPQSLVVADFNNDGLMDVGVANSLISNIGIFLSNGNLSFSDQMISAISPYTSSCSISTGDFNNDTRVDVAFGICYSENVGVLLGYGNGSFSSLTVYSTRSKSSRYSLTVRDIDNDGQADILIANYDSSSLGVLLGYGNGSFASVILFPLEYGSNPFSIIVGDFNKDRKLDIGLANNGSDSLNILLQTC